MFRRPEETIAAGGGGQRKNAGGSYRPGLCKKTVAGIGFFGKIEVQAQKPENAGGREARPAEKLKGDNMIKITAKMVVKEECIAAFQKEAEALVKGSRAEAGNVSYSLNQSTQDPCVHCFIEIWKDQAAIDSHNATTHFTSFFRAVADMMAEKAEVGLYQEVEY